MKECNRKHESHQRRNAAASLPPRSGSPPSITHRAESIPLPFPLFHSLYPFPLALLGYSILPFHLCFSHDTEAK